MFEDTASFPFVAKLERSWEVIHDEMVALRSSGFIPWPERSLYNADDWQTFGLYAFGQKLTANCALCPRTTALVEQIPGMAMAGFSRLAPGAHIRPHEGYGEYARYVLRLHLAIESNADCSLRVGGETRAWDEGRALVFCDATEHEAWNCGSTPRTVLLVDFRNPRYRFRLLWPALSAEFVEFVEQVRWPELTFRERMVWRIWKLSRLGRAAPPATGPDAQPS